MSVPNIEAYGQIANDNRTFFGKNPSIASPEPSQAQAFAALAQKIPLATAISCLPRPNRNSPIVGVSQGQLLTLLALGGCLRADESPLGPYEAKEQLWERITDTTRYSRATTIKHTEALAAAGWILLNKRAPASVTYQLSPAVWVHAEMMRLTFAADAKANVDSCKSSFDTPIDRLREQLATLLANNQSKYQVYKSQYQRFAKVFQSPLEAEIIELVARRAREARAGDDTTPTLARLFALGDAFLEDHDPPVATKTATKTEPTRDPASPPACSGLEEDPSLAPLQGSQAAEAKRREEAACKKLRDELLTIATKINRRGLVEEVLAFVRQRPPLADLEKKLKALHRLSCENPRV